MERKPTSVHWVEGLLICKKCKVPKNQEEFGPDKRERHRNFKSGYCRNCSNIFGSGFRERNKNTLKFHLSRLMSGIRARVNNGKLKKYENLEVSVTIKDLYELWETQKGKCAISGLDMTFINQEGRINTNVSPDRIDSSKGYTRENIQLVCMIINVMKSDLRDEELKYYCNAILNNSN